MRLYAKFLDQHCEWVAFESVFLKAWGISYSSQDRHASLPKRPTCCWGIRLTCLIYITAWEELHVPQADMRMANGNAKVKKIISDTGVLL